MVNRKRGSTCSVNFEQLRVQALHQGLRLYPVHTSHRVGVRCGSMIRRYVLSKADWSSDEYQIFGRLHEVQTALEEK